jgi:hypothetical protein
MENGEIRNQNGEVQGVQVLHIRISSLVYVIHLVITHVL